MLAIMGRLDFWRESEFAKPLAWSCFWILSIDLTVGDVRGRVWFWGISSKLCCLAGGVSISNFIFFFLILLFAGWWVPGISAISIPGCPASHYLLLISAGIASAMIGWSHSPSSAGLYMLLGSWPFPYCKNWTKLWPGECGKDSGFLSLYTLSEPPSRKAFDGSILVVVIEAFLEIKSLVSLFSKIINFVTKCQ